MTTTDIVNKLAAEHSLTTGRAEMIISIIIERVTDKLKTEGRVKINDFGEFKLVRNSPTFMIMSDQLISKNRVIFEPSREFLNFINTD
ncbi:MAG TPA: HU family DNA-binding protein [Ignavibacteria bacterium]|jgi:nucleoid DNA-binding protein